MMIRRPPRVKAPSFDELPDVLTMSDLKRFLHIGRNTVYDLLKTRKIASVRIGQQYRVPKAALRDFLNRHGEE